MLHSHAILILFSEIANMLVNQRHIDQMGNQISLVSLPLRIISLVPSQTELLYELGLQEEVIAQTLFCIHPQEMQVFKPRIGGTKKLDLNKTDDLRIFVPFFSFRRTKVDWMSHVFSVKQRQEFIRI